MHQTEDDVRRAVGAAREKGDRYVWVDVDYLELHADCRGFRERTMRNLEAAEAEADKLRRFKAWTHAYLDSEGVPTHPGGPHSREGCRIGDRMDLVFAEIERLREAIRRAIDIANDPHPLASREARRLIYDILTESVAEG
jgi:hypothetical protein